MHQRRRIYLCRLVAIISRFFGIVIVMFYNDHDPAHFHAKYQGEIAKFSLDGQLLDGQIRSRRALRLIRTWASQHEMELRANWARIEQGETLQRIPPLE